MWEQSVTPDVHVDRCMPLPSIKVAVTSQVSLSADLMIIMSHTVILLLGAPVIRCCNVLFRLVIQKRRTHQEVFLTEKTSTARENSLLLMAVSIQIRF